MTSTSQHSTATVIAGASNEHLNAAPRLDVGCGRSKTTGCLGIDRVNLPGVDILHDLNVFPWPLASDSFERIYCNHFLEHVSDIVATLQELHRVGKAGCVVSVRVPHFASDNFHTDVTHRVSFGYRSFDHFATNGNITYDFYTEFKFKILYRRIRFMGPARRWDPFRLTGFESLVNRFSRLYERFFVYWLPPVEIQFELEIIK